MASIQFNQVLLQKQPFVQKLQKIVPEIGKHARVSNSEADIEFVFDLHIYQLLKDLKFDVSFTKETQVVDTRRHVKIGRTDTRIGTLVIEYKHHTKFSKGSNMVKNKAIKQLQKYLKNIQTKEQENYGFLTDGIECVEIIYNRGQFTTSSPLKLDWEILHRLLRRIVETETRELSVENLIQDFTNPVRGDLVNKLNKTLLTSFKTSKSPKLKMLFTEWRRLFRFGHDDTTKEAKIEKRRKALAEIFNKIPKKTDDELKFLFILQTTYSIILKLIAYRISCDLSFSSAQLATTFISILKTKDGKMTRSFCDELEDGAIFKKLNILNLFEGDFFSWYKEPELWNPGLSKHIQKVMETISRYENSSEIYKTDTLDLFQDLYQKIIPKEVRSSLGEFYTPMWLAEHVIQTIQPKSIWRGLDPCCGSGTFLIIMIKQKLKNAGVGCADKERLSMILESVCGFDLNPIAVLTSRVNYFLKISHLLGNFKDVVSIPVYLGDATFIPNLEKEYGTEYYTYTVESEKRELDVILPRNLVLDKNFHNIISELEKKIKHQNVKKAIQVIENNKSYTKDFSLKIEKFVKQLIDLDKDNWDRIWPRIIANYMATATLTNFDIIVGNPPWIDWGNLPESYRNRIKKFCTEQKIFSGAGTTGANSLNVCALITWRVLENCLSDDGKLAFLMPEGILQQGSYSGFRDFPSANTNRCILELHDWTQFGTKIFLDSQEKFYTYVIGKTLKKRKTIKRFVRMVEK